ncbi:hypothetical protein F4809DRAFT_261053 [Biscogniauxia mediterranea]|nr:hypothetical protein F4809DRAFT_261053 [Biscogniauxia mediterranea]
MSHNILITGGSGYLGGDLLGRWGKANLPPFSKLHALVRTDAQAEAVKQYGAEPISFNPKDETAVRSAVIENSISVVYYLIDALRFEVPPYFIKALAEVKKNTGREVHFLHTTGAKLFSSHAGAPHDKPLLDTDPELYNIQKSQNAPYEIMRTGVETNCSVIEEAEKYGVRSYLFAPCIVYGESEGFGNRISIQTVAIVRAAIAVKRLYRVDSGRPTWPVCHVADNTSLYIELLRKILADENPGYGKNGYYLASSGSVAWDDIYAAMAAALAKRNAVVDVSVITADDEILEQLGQALGTTKELVPVMIGGKCTFTAVRGEKELGWKPVYKPEHILEDADAEVARILKNSNA